MSGYGRHGNRSAAGKYDGRRKNASVGPQMEWKPKAKVATDGSLDTASCCQKDNSSLIGAGKISSFSPKPALDINLQQQSLALASGMENLKLVPADNDAKHLGSVLTSNYSSKESSSQSDQSHMHPIRAKSQQERSSAAETHSYAPKGQTERGSDTFHIPNKPSFAVYFPMEDITLEKGKQIGDAFPLKADSSGRPEDTDHASHRMRFDICPKSSGIKINTPIHVKNKEKRNQLKRSMDGQNIKMLRPGMVLMKGYISCDEQISIVKTCRELGIGDGGFYQPGYCDGLKLHLKMMCLGKNWDPQTSKYSDRRPIDNSKPPGIPDKFHDMVKKAIQESNAYFQKSNFKADAENTIPPISSDICIVNFYSKTGKLGLHQDKDESAESINRGLPVVSFSIGDSADFLFGDVGNIDDAKKVTLESGDVLIFGGKSRRIFHGVASIIPNTAPSSLLEATDMKPGRLNLTFRQY